ncbi:MAG: Bug family tripartite tricarboxylate transporter substrate binding protein [Pigmentiphaga sp.]
MNAHQNPRSHSLPVLPGRLAAVCGGALLALSSLAAPTAALAQAYPNKPIHIVVPYPPGGAADTTARLVGKGLSTEFGQPVIVENRAGAGGVIGTTHVVKAAPDGYTLLLGNPGPNAILPSLYPDVAAYDVVEDFTPIAVLVDTPYFVTVPAQSSLHSIQELIEADKRGDKGSLNYGSTGNGGVSHLGGELFNMEAGTSSVHIPYKGTSPLTLGVLGSEVDWAMLTAMDANTHVADGKLRYLAATSAKRSPVSPDTPTLQELGFDNFEVNVWYGLLAPRGTPSDVVQTLWQGLEKVMADPEIQERFQSTNAVLNFSTPEAFGELIRSDSQQYADVIKKAGIQSEKR